MASIDREMSGDLKDDLRFLGLPVGERLRLNKWAVVGLGLLVFGVYILSQFQPR